MSSCEIIFGVSTLFVAYVYCVGIEGDDPRTLATIERLVKRGKIHNPINDVRSMAYIAELQAKEQGVDLESQAQIHRQIMAQKAMEDESARLARELQDVFNGEDDDESENTSVADDDVPAPVERSPNVRYEYRNTDPAGRTFNKKQEDHVVVDDYTDTKTVRRAPIMKIVDPVADNYTNTKAASHPTRRNAANDRVNNETTTCATRKNIDMSDYEDTKTGGSRAAGKEIDTESDDEDDVDEEDDDFSVPSTPVIRRSGNAIASTSSGITDSGRLYRQGSDTNVNSSSGVTESGRFFHVGITESGRFYQVGDKPPNQLTENILRKHNYYRAKHGVQPLIYSTEISKYSQNLANQLAQNGREQNEVIINTGGYGTSIHEVAGSKPLDGVDIVKRWYNEYVLYNFYNEILIAADLMSAHFTQIVWKETRKLGIAVAQNKTGTRFFVVCNYYPRGNKFGEFLENVPERKNFILNRYVVRNNKLRRTKSGKISDPLNQYWLLLI